MFLRMLYFTKRTVVPIGVDSACYKLFQRPICDVLNMIRVSCSKTKLKHLFLALFTDASLENISNEW